MDDDYGLLVVAWVLLIIGMLASLPGLLVAALGIFLYIIFTG